MDTVLYNLYTTVLLTTHIHVYMYNLYIYDYLWYTAGLKSGDQLASALTEANVKQANKAVESEKVR